MQLTFGGSLRSSPTAGAYGPRACGPRTRFARATSGGPNYRSVHDTYIYIETMLFLPQGSTDLNDFWICCRLGQM